MSDFEACPRGTYEEVRLSRALATAIENELQQYGNTMPISVITAYNKLYAHYMKQIEMENK
jgi:hypothetical protein